MSSGITHLENTMNANSKDETLETIDESKEYDSDDSDASISSEDIKKLQDEVKISFKKDEPIEKPIVEPIKETIKEPIVEPIIINEIKKTKPKKLSKRQIELEKKKLQDQLNKLEEDQEQEQEPVIEEVVEVIKPKGRGRPKKTLEEKLSKKTIIKEKVIYMIPNDTGGYDEVKNAKPLSKSHLKKIENEKKVAEEELLIGKRIVRTKSGKGDQRSTKPRSEAQIAHSKKFVAMMAEKRKKKLEDSNSNTKAIIKESIVEVVTQPIQSIPNYKPPVKSIQHQYNDFFG